MPNSPVFHLSDEESAAVLRTEGDIRLGLVVGHKNVVVGIPSEKSFLPARHLAILGTTGGGKSTTVTRLGDVRQEERFRKAYDLAKAVMRELGIFPAKGNAEQERIAMEIDEFERGYPRMTLSFLIDIAGACLPKRSCRLEAAARRTTMRNATRLPFPDGGLQSAEAQRTVRTRCSR